MCTCILLCKRVSHGRIGGFPPEWPLDIHADRLLELLAAQLELDHMVSLHLTRGAFDGASPASKALAQLMGLLQRKRLAAAGPADVPGLLGIQAHVEDALQVRLCCILRRI